MGPHVSDTGEVKPLVKRVNPAGVDQRLVTGEAKDGGRLRKSPTSDGFGRGEALRRAVARVQLMEQTAGAGVASSGSYDKRGSVRCSGMYGCNVVGRKLAR